MSTSWTLNMFLGNKVGTVAHPSITFGTMRYSATKTPVCVTAEQHIANCWNYVWRYHILIITALCLELNYLYNILHSLLARWMNQNVSADLQMEILIWKIRRENQRTKPSVEIRLLHWENQSPCAWSKPCLTCQALVSPGDSLCCLVMFLKPASVN